MPAMQSVSMIPCSPIQSAIRKRPFESVGHLRKVGEMTSWLGQREEVDAARRARDGESGQCQ